MANAGARRPVDFGRQARTVGVNTPIRQLNADFGQFPGFPDAAPELWQTFTAASGGGKAGIINDHPDALVNGPLSRATVSADLLDHEAADLSAATLDCLWQIFIEIGRCWKNADDDSAGLRSSWLEFIHAKTTQAPSYIGEYCNAASVVQELIELNGADAYPRLFLNSGVPDGPPTSRLAHAKRYVVDEFIRVQIVASGFRGFTKPRSLNYNGFIRGSRFNERPRARMYEPTASIRRGEHL